METNRTCLRNGVRDGLPIALGYFAVSFTLGIAARNAGFSPLQALLASVTNNASAGEYAAFAIIAAGGTYWEVAVMTLIANARYLLMSCALSQKIAPDTPLWQRLAMGYTVTDEIFAISSAVPGRLDPFYCLGAISVAAPGWALGTCLGVVLGNALPGRIVSALSVALYGMFLAVILPPARKNRVIAGVVAVSMAASTLFSALPVLSGLSSGTRIILLTVLIAGAAALLFPIPEEDGHAA